MVGLRWDGYAADRITSTINLPCCPRSSCGQRKVVAGLQPAQSTDIYVEIIQATSESPMVVSAR